MASRKNSPFALLLLAATALAQTADSKTSAGLSDHDSHDVFRSEQNNRAMPRQVALARCPYRQNEEGCPAASPDPEANKTLAQMPRRTGPMGPQGPPTPMRGPVYPETWGPQFSPGHALIGAAIGFGFGAAACSRNGVRSALGVGMLVGLMGAAIGAGIPSFPHYRRRGWDDEEAFRRKPRLPKPGASHPDSATEVVASHQQATETYQKNDFSDR